MSKIHYKNNDERIIVADTLEVIGKTDLPKGSFRDYKQCVICRGRIHKEVQYLEVKRITNKVIYSAICLDCADHYIEKLIEYTKEKLEGYKTWKLRVIY